MPLHLILGGRCMGKRAYAESFYGRPAPENLFDFATDDALARFKNLIELSNASEALSKIWLVNIQDGVRLLMQREREHELDYKSENIQRFFVACVRHVLQEYRDQVIIIAIGTEIGGGVVPADPFERRWRDDTGKLYQALAAEADRVDRVWAGLATGLKP